MSPSTEIAVQSEDAIERRILTGAINLVRELGRWVLIVIPLVVGALGDISKFYEFIQHSKTPLPPNEVFLFDRVGAFALSACFALFYASFEFRSAKGALDKHVKNLEKTLINAMQRQSAVLFPAIGKVLTDSQSYMDCAEMVDVLAEMFAKNSASQRVILRSVVASHRQQIKKTAQGLTASGVFMDVEERMLLTEQLYKQEQSYVVVVRGFHNITVGSFAWHEAYLDFLNDERKHVAWIYVGSETDARSQPAIEAIKAVKDRLKIPCYFSSDLDPGMVGSDCKKYWDEVGPLVEIFGADVASALKTKSALHSSKEVAWKATQLCYRFGAKISPDNAQVLTIPEAAARAGGLSIWSSEEVSKKIRAGAGRVGDDLLSKGLQHICKGAHKL